MTELLIILLLQKVFSLRSSKARLVLSKFFASFSLFWTNDLRYVWLFMTEYSSDLAPLSSMSMVTSLSVQIFSINLVEIFMMTVWLRLAFAYNSLLFALLLTSNNPKILPFSSEAISYTFSPSSLNNLICPSIRQQIASTSSPLLQTKELKFKESTSHRQRKLNFSELFIPFISGTSRKYKCSSMKTVFLLIPYKENELLEMNYVIPSGNACPERMIIFSAFSPSQI